LTTPLPVKLLTRLICATIAGEHSTSTERAPLHSSFDNQLTQSRTPHELMRSISPRSMTAVPAGILSTSSPSSLSSSITPPSFT
jgi:hypothetical protein